MRNIFILTAFLLIINFAVCDEHIADQQIITAASTDVSIEPMIAQDEGLIVNFQNAPLGEVLDYLSDVAGLIIMSDSYLNDHRVSIMSKQPISIDEIVSVINTALKEKNFAAVRSDRTLRIVDISSAKHLNIEVSSGSNPERIASGDHMITHIIPVRYADATKLQENLQSLIPSYAVISANQSSNSLILTDTAANVKRILNIVSALDMQMSAMLDVKVFRLDYANARNTATMLNDVFKTDAVTSSTDRRNARGGGMDPFSRMREAMSGGRDNADASSGINVQVKAAADESTNTIIVTGPTDTLAVIEKVIKDLDVNPNTEQTIFIYTLKNAQASNLKTVLNNLFREMQNLNRAATSGTRGTSAAAARAAAARDSSSNSDLSDQAYVEADADTNALLVMTSAKNYEKLKPIIQQLDEPVPQVLIRVLLAEITTSDNFDLGAEFSVLNMRDSGGSTLFETDFIGGATGGLITRTLEGDVDFALRALQEVGKLNVLSRPYILTSNNQQATITVGQEVPFITDTRITDSGQTINTIRYQDIGIMLRVTPTINPDGLVIMDVRPEISTTTADTVPISEKVNASVFAKRSSSARVAILNGQTIVIGGLMQDQETDAVKKVPLLGDIPLLGEIFKRNTIKKEKTELLIFLTPQVASGPLQLKGVSDAEKSTSREVAEPEKNKVMADYLRDMDTVYKEQEPMDE